MYLDNSLVNKKQRGWDVNDIKFWGQKKFHKVKEEKYIIAVELQWFLMGSVFIVLPNARVFVVNDQRRLITVLI